MRIVYVLLFLAFVMSCNKVLGTYGRTHNIKESKRRGVFVCEYEVSPNPHIINDSLKIQVKEAWVERLWGPSGDFFNDTQIKPGYQLCVSIEKGTLPNYYSEWVIGDFGDDRYFMMTKGKVLYCMLKDMPDDIEEFVVQTRPKSIQDKENKVILGKFVVRKKQKKE